MCIARMLYLLFLLYPCGAVIERRFAVAVAPCGQDGRIHHQTHLGYVISDTRVIALRVSCNVHERACLGIEH
jgi:hypothetical protein